MTRLTTIENDAVMQAAVLQQKAPGSKDREISLQTVPIPEPQPHEVLVRILLAGICGTDLEVINGYKPLSEHIILGHEFVGCIAKYHPDVHDHIYPLHTRVVVEINCLHPSYGENISSEIRAHHPNRTALGIFGAHGAYAEYCCVPISNVHVVPDHVSNKDAVFCEPVAAVCRIMQQVKVHEYETIAVLGAGRMGWLCALVLSKCGANVVVLSRGKHTKRDNSLAAACGAKTRVLQDDEQHKYQLVVDCTGQAQGFNTAKRIVRPRGTIILKSTFAEGAPLDLTDIVVNEVRIIGSRCGPFNVALHQIAQSTISPSMFISEIVDLSDIAKGFKLASTSGILKVLVRTTVESKHNS